jgi:hypothetical protein
MRSSIVNAVDFIEYRKDAQKAKEEAKRVEEGRVPGAFVEAKPGAQRLNFYAVGGELLPIPPTRPMRKNAKKAR